MNILPYAKESNKKYIKEKLDTRLEELILRNIHMILIKNI